MSKKTIVVTGGTKGIGKAITQKFASEGFDIIICSRSLEDLEKLKVELESAYHSIFVHIFKADLSKKEEVKAFSAYCIQQANSIEILVNNTGVFIPGQVHDEPDGNLELMIETNLYSAYYMTQEIVPIMIEQKSGHIFNMCSVASIMAYPNGGSYSISKYAMYGMTKCLREELKDKNIRVTAILPGATLTASWDGMEVPENRLMKPEDVAETVWSASIMSPSSVVEEIVIRPQLGDL